MLPPTPQVPAQGSIHLSLGTTWLSGVTAVAVDAGGFQVVMHGEDGPKLVEFGDASVSACDFLRRLLAAGRLDG